ncbi:hypothetical protein GBAR_LOCUS85 [Geodia barretti]|uniref:Uncharacterized protein n=1 Tax=Geodia barretti TaxID=519541 RepID=A0AA35QS04_GEOBA|nr:hypothetical protein GBAR_LOCUS85 [Geodia barretti]
MSTRWTSGWRWRKPSAGSPSSTPKWCGFRPTIWVARRNAPWTRTDVSSSRPPCASTLISSVT